MNSSPEMETKRRDFAKPLAIALCFIALLAITACNNNPSPVHAESETTGSRWSQTTLMCAERRQNTYYEIYASDSYLDDRTETIVVGGNTKGVLNLKKAMDDIDIGIYTPYLDEAKGATVIIMPHDWLGPIMFAIELKLEPCEIDGAPSLICEDMYISKPADDVYFAMPKAFFATVFTTIDDAISVNLDAVVAIDALTPSDIEDAENIENHTDIFGPTMSPSDI